MSSNAWLPDLDSVRCFVHLAELGNFRRAAERVGLSPAAFSERIKRLEEQLDAPLFVRSTRHVQITESGSRVLPRATELLRSAEGLRALANDDHAPQPFALELGTRFELGLSWIVPALAELREAAPHRTLHLSFGDGPDLLRAVEAGSIDALVASVRLSRADLAYELLHEESYVLVGAPELIDDAPLRRPDDAAGHVLLDLHAALPLFRYFLDAAPARQTWRFGAREYVGTIAAVRHRALEGAGVAVLPRYYIEEAIEDGALVPLLPRVRLRSDWFRLVWRAGHPRDAELHALAEQLRERPLQ